MRRVHVSIDGRVQGVFFRATCVERARAPGVAGWVRNTSDGRVEAEFEGETRRSSAMLGWCREGPPHAPASTRVDVARGSSPTGRSRVPRHPASRCDRIPGITCPVSIRPHVPAVDHDPRVQDRSRTRRSWSSSRASPSSSVPTARASRTWSMRSAGCWASRAPGPLRGGHMADVIFAGTPSRPALGMAEVKLVIDNRRGQDPRADERDRGRTHDLPQRRIRVPHQRPGRAAAGRAGAAQRDGHRARPPHRGRPGSARGGARSPSPRSAASTSRRPPASRSTAAARSAPSASSGTSIRTCCGSPTCCPSSGGS